MSSTFEKAGATLRAKALSYPETHEDHPWGHAAFKVKGKVFLFMNADKEGLSLSCKLPRSNELALMLPFASPTHYGMGKYGWVTADLKGTDQVPLGLLLDWLDESFRAIGPKKLVAALPVKSDAPPLPPSTLTKQKTAKKTAKKTA